MEELLKKYLQKKTNLDYIHIDWYDTDGSNCSVEYYTDNSHYYKTQDNINIWDMLLFLNTTYPDVNSTLREKDVDKWNADDYYNK